MSQRPESKQKKRVSTRRHSRTGTRRVKQPVPAGYLILMTAGVLGLSLGLLWIRFAPQAVPGSVLAEAPSVITAPAEPSSSVSPVTSVSPVVHTSSSIPAPSSAAPVAPASSPVPSSSPAPAPVSRPVLAPVQKMPVAASRPPSGPPPELPRPQRGTLLFVFDDAGHNLQQLQPFLDLPFACTIAVLPGLQYSAEAARRIRTAGKELILHQPMQALDLKRDPGPGALLPGMSASQIRSIILANLAEVGPVVGMNNHEGSLITADRNAMQAVLETARKAGIYFLDSRTTADTVAPVLARETGMQIWERAVFLDNTPDRASMIDAVHKGMKVAEQKGAAIMIGHIWSNDLASVLAEMYPELVSQGFSLSTIARIAVSGEDLE